MAGLNLEAFHAAQRRTEEAGRRGDWANAQISPWEWQALGGNPQEYTQLYGPNAFYNANGSLTQAGQQYNVPAARGPNETQARDPYTGNPIQGITGAHQTPWGGFVQPNVDTSNANSTIRSQIGLNDYNLAQQIAGNRYGQSDAYGSSQWVMNPDGTMTRNTSLSGWQQRKLEQRQGQDYQIGTQADQRVNQMANMGQYDLSGMPKIAGSEDLLGERRRVEDQLYADFERRNSAIFDREKKDLEQSLADRGIPLTSGRAQEEMMALSRRQDDARGAMRTQATQLGQSEFTTNFDYGQKNRNQAIGEYENTRYAPMNEYSQLRGMQDAIKDPNVADPERLNVNSIDAGQVGLGYGELDLGRYLGDLDAKTKVQVARIQASAAGEGGEEDGSGMMDTQLPDSLGGGGGGGQPLNYTQQLVNGGTNQGPLTTGGYVPPTNPYGKTAYYGFNQRPPAKTSTSAKGASPVGGTQKLFGG